MADQFIQIILRNGVVDTWLAYDDNNHILAKGEPAAVWEVRLGADGAPLLEADGITPQGGHLLYHLIGDGYTRFSQLTPLWPVKKGSFNSVVSNRQGSGRNLTDITLTNATHTYQTLDQALEAVFHPYGRPAWSQFDPALPPLEVGQTLTLNFPFTWVSSNPQNVQAGSVAIQQQFNGVTTTLVAGLDASGSFTPAGSPTLRGTTIGQTASFVLTGSNSRNEPMTPATRVQEWQGKHGLFLHTDAQWLISGMSAKAGETPGVYISDETMVVSLINAALDGNTGALGNGSYGLQTLDGGTGGKRAYLAYPKAYRTSARFIDPNFNVDQGVVLSREITVPRNGVNVVYVLLGLDLRIVQQLSSYIS